MSKRIVVCLVAAWLVGSAGTSAQEKDKGAAGSKQVCEKFMKSLYADDLDGAMKLVAVPWFFGEMPGKSKVIATFPDVKADLKKISDWSNKAVKPTDVRLEVVDNLDFDAMLGKFGAKIKPEERKHLDMVLRKTDRVLNVNLILAGKKGGGQVLLKFHIMAGERDGQFKILGLKDPF